MLLGQTVLLVTQAYISRSFITARWSKHELKAQLRFGIPNTFSGLTYYILDSIDRLFINEFGSLDDVGVYSLGYRLGIVIQALLIIPFTMIWVPMRMEYRNDGNATLFHRLVLTYYFIVTLLAFVVSSMFAKEIVGILAGKGEFLPAFRVVPLIMIGHILYGSVNIIDSGIMFERKMLYLFYALAAGLITNIILNALFIPKFGYIAAAFTTIGSYGLVVVLIGILSNRLYKLQWEPVRLLVLITTSMLTAGLGYAISIETLILSIGLKAFMVAALMVIWYRFVLREWERKSLTGNLHRVFQR